MDKTQLFRTRISGTGSYLPEKLLTNTDLEKLVDTNDQWIRERTGIVHRHIASEEQATSDLAFEASKKALDMAGIQPEDIEMIIVATVTGDYLMPNTGCILQTKLGCRNIMAVDISAACTGFVYALSMANKYVQTGMYKHVLVVGAETLSRFVNYKDRDTCILFGDGAGAVIASRANEGIEEEKSSNIISEHLHADGDLGELFDLKGGGSKHPISYEMLDQGLHNMSMKGREVFKHAVRTMSLCCTEALEANKISKNDIDWLVPHQANTRILEAISRHFEIPNEKIATNLAHMGNTSAATIPVVLDEYVRAGKIKRDQMLMLTAFGAGITSGSILMRF